MLGPLRFLARSGESCTGRGWRSSTGTCTRRARCSVWSTSPCCSATARLAGSAPWWASTYATSGSATPSPSSRSTSASRRTSRLAIYSLLPYTEIAGGLYYPMGGIHRLSTALARLAGELGARIHYGARVSRIEQAGRKVTGVALEDGSTIPGDVVVSNADLPYTYATLLAEPHPRIDSLEFSCSVVLMYLGAPALPPAAASQPGGAAAHACGLRGHLPPTTCAGGSAYYICAPSRTDPSVAPPGSENLFVLVLVPSQDPARPIDWSAEGPRVEARCWSGWSGSGSTVCGATSSPGAPSRRTTSPRDFGNLRGEAFGLAHGIRQIGLPPAAQPPPPALQPVLRRAEHASRLRLSDGAHLRALCDRAVLEEQPV